MTGLLLGASFETLLNAFFHAQETVATLDLVLVPITPDQC